MGLYFQNISVSPSNAGKFSSPFQLLDNSSDIESRRNVLVQLNHHGIEFYYETYDETHSVSPHQSQVLLYIPIDDPQKTGYTLLNIKEPNGVLKSRSDIAGYCLHYGDVINNRNMLELPGNTNGHTYFELLLCFFDDLNNHNSDINKFSHELATHTRDKLNHCEVYDLIRKKYSFYEDLKDFHDSGRHTEKKNDLNISYNIFLDEILGKKIEDWIPGYCMDERNWFLTPEEELRDLAVFDKEFEIDKDKERFEDIQKALLAKHAVVKAMKLNATSVFIPLISNIIATCLYLGVFIYWLTDRYENSIWFLITALAVFTIGMIVHAVQQGSKLSLFLPRIIVSIATAWFVLIASEEILKNQLNLDKLIIIIGIPLVMMLLFVFVFAEIRQHSPYYIYKKNSTLYGKTMLVIIYSFNFTVSLGIIAHPMVVDGYIKRSGVFENYIYSNDKDTLMMVKGEWESYRNKLLSAQSSNIVAFSMIPSQELKALLYLNDTIVRHKYIADSETNDSKKNIIEVFNKTYNNKILSLQYVDSVLSKEMKFRKFDKAKFRLLDAHNLKINNYTDSIAIPLNSNELEISDAIIFCDTVLESIGNQLINFGDVDGLIKNKTFQENITKKEKLISLNYPLKKNSEDILRYETTFSFAPDRSFILYPLMLVFQTLIVILLAIVGQLIISDKTVTEAL
jgi:hypothetical protein